MKEISGELRDRDTVICVNCGAIFEGASDMSLPCPECDKEGGLAWVTQGHSWIRFCASVITQKGRC